MLQSGTGGNQFHLDLSLHSADGDKRRGLGHVDRAGCRRVYFPAILRQNTPDLSLFHKIAISGSAAAGNNSKESKIPRMIGKPFQSQYIINIILEKKNYYFHILDILDSPVQTSFF